MEQYPVEHRGTDDTLVVNVLGIYWVDVEAGGCVASDTVLVFQAEGALLELDPIR
ncbi:MAG: hypothetical protein IPL52_11605 [Flavobacteriales bacterium]|nr:hypothetical protein [Flavobacteriales bacterium]